jgi:hypothetical protein
MTWAGWITMILSVGFVTGLFVWCIVQVLVRKPGHLHGLEDIDTGDLDEEPGAESPRDPR